MLARLTLAALLAALSATQAAQTIPASDPRIGYRGRNRINADGSRSFDWEACQMEMTVQGATFVQMLLSMPKGVQGRFNVFVNDKRGLAPPVPVNSSGTSWTVLEGLDASQSYTVRVYNVAEPAKDATWYGPFTFAGFVTDDGATVSGVPRLSRNMAILGDSITAGSGNIGTAPCVESLASTDHSLSYGNLLCEALAANCSFVAYSGKGMYENCCDNPPFSGERMPSYWLQNFGGASYVEDWDPLSFVPDAVIVNLGTNDWGHNHTAQPGFVAGFVSTYLQWIANVTATYGNPRLPFFAGVGAITNDYLPGVQYVIGNATAAGYNVTLANMFGACSATGCGGCNGHPNTTQHAAMAAAALPIIRSVMGW